MKIRTFMFCTAALTMGACSYSDMDAVSGPRYTPRAEIADRNYDPIHYVQDHMDKEAYKEYEYREPCQNYRQLPRNMTDDNCGMTEEEMAIAAVEVSEPVEYKREQKVLPIVRSYTILFDHDSADLRAGEQETLDRALREIAKYNPTQVTVTGYTDTSGAVSYNQKLSREREQAVSRALLNRGIESRTLDRNARGEYNLAVETPDGVRKQENRRVVVDFRR